MYQHLNHLQPIRDKTVFVYTYSATMPLQYCKANYTTQLC